VPPEKPESKKPPPVREVYEGEVVAEPKKSPEPKSHGLPPEAELQSLPEKEGFGTQLDEFLQELNLSRRHIVYGIGCIVLLVVLIWGGFAGYRFYKNRKKIEEPPPKPPTQISAQETGIPASTQVGQPSVVSAIVGDTGIASTISIGQTELVKTAFAYYIMTFRRLQNAYETNINDLLNQSTDRRARLHSHVAILKKLHADGTELFQKIKDEIERIQ
jgi:hypothetical protein